MRAKLKELTATLLKMASAEFSNHGCNDFDLVKDGGLSEGEALKLHKDIFAEDRDGVRPSTLTQDWLVMDHMAHLLLKEASAEEDIVGPQREISNTNEILSHLHCALCLRSMPPGESPQSWARRDVGFTRQGIQVWCARHNVNIMHMDFQGKKHPANSTRLPIEGEGEGKA